ncbi:COMM domain-containing protein 4 [Coccinella septempunctata]|uniref:COMM domain-containing protein 4 n=1 Tax=Coccinella septempunctata TaxID=41139 RepID=UPI001D06AFFA|nr:COMM domain-containing protein 4 [Coccinella septempunctata]
MKFRFCGNSDCPDWVLAIIINNLAKLSSAKLKLLSQIVADGIIKPPLEIEEAEKLFSESKLDSDLELKACIACLRFIIFSTCKFQCETSALFSELQQLGLPREHSSSLKKVVDEKQDAILKILKASGLKVNPLESVSVEVAKESSAIIMNVQVNGQTEQCTIAKETVSVLLKNLKESKMRMEELKGYNQKILQL